MPPMAPDRPLALTGLEQNNEDQHQSRQQLQNRNSNFHNLSLQQNKAQRGYSSKYNPSYHIVHGISRGNSLFARKNSEKSIEHLLQTERIYGIL